MLKLKYSITLCLEVNCEWNLLSANTTSLTRLFDPFPDQPRSLRRGLADPEVRMTSCPYLKNTRELSSVNLYQFCPVPVLAEQFWLQLLPLDFTDDHQPVPNQLLYSLVPSHLNNNPIKSFQASASRGIAGICVLLRWPILPATVCGLPLETFGRMTRTVSSLSLLSIVGIFRAYLARISCWSEL